MSYKLDKPHTTDEKNNFITEYNHQKGLHIEETSTAIYALEPNEIMQNNTPCINPNYEAELKETQRLIQIEVIKKELENLDLKSIRAIRENDLEYLNKHNTLAKQLRDQLHTLENT